ncbi:methyltransferase family protein [Stackebrandtia albiflava]|uniref:Methyltransferase family protein n=1 Tax=Stackebrandtia albiflava TaxID=406432 RepID=A0A562V207_9ACTN|nr:SAM-dependent methyltransferase [Stackebrandtia albiflava]TWJ11891.1 methyltransferase family protein [Stackebrandtia albiflava]
MTEPLARVREALGDADRLVRAIGSGRRAGTEPTAEKVEVRPVALKNGLRLQVTRFSGPRPTVANLEPPATEALDALLAEPFRHWLVETTDATLQLRFTKRGKPLLHEAAADRERDLSHDRVAPHLIDPGDPLFRVLGASAAKRRQVDAFLRAVAGEVDRLPSSPVVADLGCGNAYLTFAVYRYLTGTGRTPRLTGVDVRDDQRRRNTAIAAELGWADSVVFQATPIADADLSGVDMVLALHACDTATDDALAAGVRAGAGLLFAAPCCHHDVAAQLREVSPPPGYRALTGDGILRERFADVLTDSLRALVLREHGYRVDVVEFIASAHTPRNTLIRAVRRGGEDAAASREYRELTGQWGVTPKLATLLDV